MVAAASTITLGTLIASVRRQFGDLDSVQITDADIAAWTNEGQRQIISDNPLNEATSTAPSIVGVNDYTNLPADRYEISAVKYDTVLLTAMDFNGMQAQYGINMEFKGIPASWSAWGNTLSLYPAPNAVKNITVYYKKAPTNVVNPGDFLGVPDRYANALRQYVLARAYEKDEQPELLAAQESLFAASTQKLSNLQNKRGGAWLVVGDPANDDEMAYFDEW